MVFREIPRGALVIKAKNDAGTAVTIQSSRPISNEAAELIAKANNAIFEERIDDNTIVILLNKEDK